MKHLQKFQYSIIVLTFVIACPLAGAQQKPNIMILTTGGTIAGAAATGTQSGYKSGAVGIDTMVSAVPGIEKLANIKGEQISNVESQDMSFEIMLCGRRGECPAKGHSEFQPFRISSSIITDTSQSR